MPDILSKIIVNDNEVSHLISVTSVISLWWRLDGSAHTRGASFNSTNSNIPSFHQLIRQYLLSWDLRAIVTIPVQHASIQAYGSITLVQCNACKVSWLWWACITHWGRVTYICVSKLTIIGSDNGLSFGRRQGIIWTNIKILLFGPLGINFNEIIQENAFENVGVNGGHLVSASMW